MDRTTAATSRVRTLLLGVAALALLGLVLWLLGSHWEESQEAQRQALAEGWRSVAELAAGPAPAPAGTTVAATFLRGLFRFRHSGDSTHLRSFVAWLDGPGPHRLRAENSPGLGDQVMLEWEGTRYGATPHLLVEGACVRLAHEGDPALLPALLELARALRSEAGWRELDSGIEVAMACLDRLESLGAARPPLPAGLRPDAGELAHARAWADVRLVGRVETHRLADSGPELLASAPARVGEALRRQVVLETALPPPSGTWERLLGELGFDQDADAVARIVRRGKVILADSVRTRLAELGQRWSQVLD